MAGSLAENYFYNKCFSSMVASGNGGGPLLLAGLDLMRLNKNDVVKQDIIAPILAKKLSRLVCVLAAVCTYSEKPSSVLLINFFLADLHNGILARVVRYRFSKSYWRASGSHKFFELPDISFDFDDDLARCQGSKNKQKENKAEMKKDLLLDTPH
jgi:hypothetical protein